MLQQQSRGHRLWMLPQQSKGHEAALAEPGALKLSSLVVDPEVAMHEQARASVRGGSTRSSKSFGRRTQRSGAL